MNERLEKFARDSLKEDLVFLGLHDILCLYKFKLMYSPDRDFIDTQTIDEIVDKMPATQLDWAMTQVQNSLKKHINENN